MGKSMKGERIETVDGVGYLYGGKIYSEQEYESILTGQGVDGNMADGGQKKSSVSKKNVASAGEELMGGMDVQGMTTNVPPVGNTAKTTPDLGYAFKDTDPEFYKITQEPLSEGTYNTWLQITQNDQDMFPTMKRARLDWLSKNSPTSLPQQQQLNTPSVSGGNQGQEYIDPTTGTNTIQLPTQVAGSNAYQKPAPLGQQQVAPTEQIVETMTNRFQKTQKYMGKEAPVIDAGSFGDAMRQFASSNQDPMGKVFYWNGKAYKYQIAQPGQVGPKNVAPKKKGDPTGADEPVGQHGFANKPNIRPTEISTTAVKKPLTPQNQSDDYYDQKYNTTNLKERNQKNKSLITMSKQPQQSPNI